MCAGICPCSRDLVYINAASLISQKLLLMFSRPVLECVGLDLGAKTPSNIYQIHQVFKEGVYSSAEVIARTSKSKSGMGCIQL